MAINCNDELNYVCEECYQVEYTDCEAIVIDLGLSSNTSYCVKLYDKFGNTYQQTITTNSSGAFIIDETVLPDNFFNQYAGKIELQIFANCTTTTRTSFTAAYTLFNCILLVNSEDTEDADNDSGTENVVRIIDSETGDLIVNVPCPNDYPVLQFSGIKDIGSPYTNSIVDI